MVKFDHKAFYAAHKKGVLICGALVLTLVLGLAGWLIYQKVTAEPVYVYPFDYVGMTEYWGDTQESYGPVSADNIQTVYLTQTQTVTEILVEEGDTVKAGELIMTFDTTLSALKLERKRLEVEKVRLELEAANTKLNDIRNMKPMQLITLEADNEFDYDTLGDTLYAEGGYEICYDEEIYSGSSEASPVILWVRDDVGFYADMMGAAQYAVIRVTEGNREFGAKKVWIGVERMGNGGVQFFTPQIGDPYMEGYEGDGLVASTQINIGGSYTAAQLATMRKEQEQKIKELEFKVKMLNAEYKVMEKEFNDGNIYAEVDGTVVSVLTEEEAKRTKQPVLKVSGGGGYYVEGYVSELEKEKLTPGYPVTVNDWNTGNAYEGEVVSVGDFPAQGNHYTGMGNPNASFYSFRVFVDGSADLQTDGYVSVSYTAAGGTDSIYLENPFIRTENGRSYVMVEGPDDRLEQRFVTTGKNLWGSYTEIRSGLTTEDLVAFPYGKDVKPGVKTQKGDMSTLYG